jgi:hypothetical protein
MMQLSCNMSHQIRKSEIIVADRLENRTRCEQSQIEKYNT